VLDRCQDLGLEAVDGPALVPVVVDLDPLRQSRDAVVERIADLGPERGPGLPICGSDERAERADGEQPTAEQRPGLGVRGRPAGDVEPLVIEAPSDVGAALMFGLLYAAVLLGVAIARQHSGDAGLFLVAALSGLTDVDAITLSSSRLLARDAIDAHLAWRLILTGALANIALKGVAVLLLADRKMMRGAVSAFVVALGTGLAVLALWPL
jgi:hypothetical protein